MALPYTRELRQVWRSMLSRCYNDKLPSWPRYGGRGIAVCERWRSSFEAFYFDVCDGFRPGLSIDRFPDNDGNYEPGNVRWATRIEQARNTRRTVRVRVGGVAHAAAAVALEMGVPRGALLKLLKPSSGARRGPIAAKDVVPGLPQNYEWPRTDEELVYRAVVAHRAAHGAVNVSAVARGLGFDRKRVERVLDRLQRDGAVAIVRKGAA